METIKAKIGDREIAIGHNGNSSIFTVNGEELQPDIIGSAEKGWSVILNKRSYKVELFKKENGIVELLVNGRRYPVALSDKYDELLKSLGMDRNAAAKVSNLKAPMPGKVISVGVGSGNSVNSGDAILVLEAMKMENVIKSPIDGVIASVDVKTGETVEKNEVMVTFE